MYFHVLKTEIPITHRTQKRFEFEDLISINWLNYPRLEENPPSLIKEVRERREPNII